MRSRWYFAIVSVLTFAAMASMFVFPARSVAVASLATANLAWLVFCLWYTIRAKWWKHQYGWNMMGVAFWLCVVLSLFSAGILFGQYPHYEVVWAAAFINLTVLGVQRTYYMEMAQRHGNERQRPQQ